MKKSFFALAVLLSLSSFAHADESLKVCQSSIPDLEKPRPFPRYPIKYEIVKRASGLVAIGTITVGGVSKAVEIAATAGEFSVRPGVSALDDRKDSAEIMKLNQAEYAIFVTALSSRDPGFKDLANPGLDLSKIRSAKIYKMGDTSTPVYLGMIVEAKDEAGKDLGSFATGILGTAPCN